MLSSSEKGLGFTPSPFLALASPTHCQQTWIGVYFTDTRPLSDDIQGRGRRQCGSSCGLLEEHVSMVQPTGGEPKSA